MQYSLPAEEAQRLREHIATWKAITPFLEAERRAQIKASDLQRDMAALAGAYATIRRDTPPRLTSGLVEQQAWFSKFRQLGQTHA